MSFEYSNIEDLQIILDQLNPSSILLVTGKSSYFSSGAKGKIDLILKNHKTTHFDDFTTNPKVEDLKMGITVLKRNNCDLIIAIGGGSVIDIAKSINILSMHEQNPEDYITKKLNLERKGNFLIAIPTTSGTGSEATHFAVVYINKKKYSLAHKEWLLPDCVILDSSLTEGLPKSITAATGMDALCQATEAYWSVNSTEESKKYSRDAIKIILSNIENAVNKPTLESRESMMKAANLAGKAINIAKTTACHAISYPITSYFNVPHGHATGLTLGEMFLFNTKKTNNQCNDPRGKDYVETMMKSLIEIFNVDTSEQAKEKINHIMDCIGLKRSLSSLNISKEDHELIIRNGFNPERVKNNPLFLTEIDLREILQKIK